MRHEIYLARAGFAALAAVTAVMAFAGAVGAGSSGVLSALIGCALIAGNHGAAVASTGWARRFGPRVIAAGYAVFVVRMLLVLGILGSLKGVGWVNGPLLAASFCAALVATLAVECITYARGSYVPGWMRRAGAASEARSR